MGRFSIGTKDLGKAQGVLCFALPMLSCAQSISCSTEIRWNAPGNDAKLRLPGSQLKSHFRLLTSDFSLSRMFYSALRLNLRLGLAPYFTWAELNLECCSCDRSTVFEPVKFDWLYLDQLSHSSRLLHSWRTPGDRLWVKRRSLISPAKCAG